MTERRSVAILFTGILIIAAASLGPSLMGEPMAEPDAKVDETLDEYADAPRRGGSTPAPRDPALTLLENAHLSAVVLEELLVDPDAAIPSPLLAHARAVAVIPASPDTTNGRAASSKGLMAGRSATGEWSSPIHVFASGLDAIPPTEGDLVLLFTRDRDVAALAEGPLPLGDGPSVAPGPVGRAAGIGSTGELAAVYAWTRSHDRVTGSSVERLLLGVDEAANATAYGQDFDANAALDGELDIPSGSEEFRDTLVRHAPRLGS